jgi:solute carrier family 35, member E1
MSALGTLSAGLLSLRRRVAPAPVAASPPQLPAIKLPDGGPLVLGRQLRPSLLLPAASQPARRHTLHQPAAAESAG